METIVVEPMRLFVEGQDRRVHDLKCWPVYFAALAAGDKTCEVRFNDRDYQNGDVLCLREYDPDFRRYSGRTALRLVTDVLAYSPVVPVVQEGCVVMSLKPLRVELLPKPDERRSLADLSEEELWAMKLDGMPRCYVIKRQRSGSIVVSHRVCSIDMDAGVAKLRNIGHAKPLSQCYLREAYAERALHDERRAAEEAS